MRTPFRRLRVVAIAVPAAVLTAALLTAALLSPIAGGAAASRDPGVGDPGGLAAAASVRTTVHAAPLDAQASRLRRGEPALPLALSSLAGYRWPLPKGRLTQAFGPSAGNSFLVDGVEAHDGIDLATFCGDRVVAAHDGVVLAAGRAYEEAVGWRGDLAPYLGWLDGHSAWPSLPITVVIDDGDTYRSVYAHFSRIVVSVGQRVRAGQLLGYEGRTGHATGCHLHFGLFSPLEPATWALRQDVMRRYTLPPAETARVDPLLVLPARTAPAGADSARPRSAAFREPVPE